MADGFDLQGFLIFSRSVGKATLHVINAAKTAIAEVAVGHQLDNIGESLLGIGVARLAKIEVAQSKVQVPIFGT